MTTEDDLALTRGEIQSRASRGVLWTGVHALVSLPLNVVATVVTARVLDVNGYGELAYLTVVLAVALQVTDFGYTSSAVQWGSQSRVVGDDRELGRRLAGVTGFHVLVQAPVFVGTSWLVLQEYGSAWAAAYGAVSFVFLYVSCASLALVLDQRNDRLAKIALVTNIAGQAMVIVAALVSRDPITVLVVRAASAVLPGLVAIGFLRPSLRRAVLVPRRPWGTPAGYRAFALYSWLATSVAILVYSRSEIILLDKLSGAEQTALFALAFSISQQLTGPIDALVAPLIPATASLVAAHGDHLARAIRRAMTLSSLLAGLLLAGPVPALFALIPALYGPGFGDAAGLFLVLGAISTFQSATSVVGVLAQARRAGRGLLLANACALVVNIAAAVALIPSFGAWGAMAANCLGQLVSIVLLVRAATRGNGEVTVAAIVGSVKPWFAAVPATVAAVLTATFIVPTATPVGAALVAGIVGTAIYVVTLRVSRWGPARDDLDAIAMTLPSWLGRPVRMLCPLVAA